MENEEIIDALSGVWYLATSVEDQPHVRPLDKAAEVNGNIYFGTARTKKMFDQILMNPRVEVFAMNDFGTCRFSADAYEEEDENIAKEAFEKMGKPFDADTSVAIRLENIESV